MPQHEYKAPDGRTYWSHSVTKQSRWDKPDDLKSPFEVSFASVSCGFVLMNSLVARNGKDCLEAVYFKGQTLLCQQRYAGDRRKSLEGILTVSLPTALRLIVGIAKGAQGFKANCGRRRSRGQTTRRGW